MTAFLFKRVLAGLVTLFVIATLCFFIQRTAPGSPLTTERNLPPEVELNLKRAYNLDKPLLTQYLLQMRNYLRGDLGISIKYNGRRVEEFLLPALPVSLQLGGLTILFTLLVGLAAGVAAAARQNRPLDHAAMSVALLGICVPNFLLGPLLVMVFALWLGWLPVAGWPQSFAPDELAKLVLPVLTLSFVHIAYVSRLARAGMLDVLGRDYIRTARAKGLDETAVVLKHGLKNGVTPVVSYAGPMAAYVLTGSVVVERVFNIPGLGQHFVDAALNRDYDIFLGCLLLYSVLVIALNVLADVAYCLLDPRVRPS